MVPLGEVLTRSKEQIEIDPHEQYKQVTIKLWGQGVVLRDEVAGSQISGGKRFVVRPRQFILSRIDARNGAFGLVPDYLDGAVVSNDFPAFTPDASHVLPSFLGWMSKTRGFVDLCRAASEGTTNRVRLKEHLFMATKIVLPPLPEQQRIVARIEDLATRIEEARGLRRQTVTESEALWRSSLNSAFDLRAQPTVPLETACEAVVDNLHSTPVYDGDAFACIRSQDIGWGTLNYTTALRTSEAEFTKRTRRGEPRVGDIVYVREGDVGRCAIVDGSQRFSLGQRVMVFRPDQRLVTSRYLMYQLRSPSVLDEQVLVGKTGTTSHHVNIKHLKQVRILMPSLDEQYEIEAYLNGLENKYESLKQLQLETAAELDAMLPSVLDRAFKDEL